MVELDAAQMVHHSYWAMTRKELLMQLPAGIGTLWRDLEEYGDVRIRLRHVPDLPSTNILNPDLLALRANWKGAEILYGAVETLKPKPVLHELLHLQRFWPQKIPQIVPFGEYRNPGTWKVTSSIENVLEHLVIVPEEADYGFEPYEFWTDINRKIWSMYPWNHIQHPFARRKQCLLGILSVSRLTTDTEVKEMAKEAIKNEGLWDDACKYREQLERVFPRKPDMLAVTARFLEIPRNSARLQYLDIRSRREVLKKLPLR